MVNNVWNTVCECERIGLNKGGPQAEKRGVPKVVFPRISHALSHTPNQLHTKCKLIHCTPRRGAHLGVGLPELGRSSWADLSAKFGAHQITLTPSSGPHNF